MAFEKGAPKPAGSGRKKGTPNKKKVARVADYLAERDINPAQEILNEIGQMEDPKDRAKTWLELIKYCEAPARHEESDSDELNPDEFADVSTADLLKLVKTNKGNA